MKKICRYLLLCSLFLGAVAAFPLAAESKESELYYVNAQILKIFPHTKGYYVVYRRASSGSGEVFIPIEWFGTSDSKADISLINTRVNPYISFFLKEGKCEYVRISAPQNLGSSIWGSLQYPQQYDEKFDGIESLTLEF